MDHKIQLKLVPKKTLDSPILIIGKSSVVKTTSSIVDKKFSKFNRKIKK